MSRRQYPVADYYEDRERDFYRSGRRSTREYDDFDESTTYGGRSQPDFMREDYGRSNAGPLVRRAATVVDDDLRSNASRRTRDIDRETVTFRESDRQSERPRHRSRFEDDSVTVRRSESRGPGPRDVERETDVTIKERDRPRERPREVERDEFSIRRSETEGARRPRDFERDDFVIRRGEGEWRRGPRDVEKEEIVIRREENDTRSRRGRSRSGSRERIVIKARSKSRGRVDSEKVIFDSSNTSRRGGRSRSRSIDRITIKEDDVRSRRGRSSSREKITVSARSKSQGRVEKEEIKIKTDDVHSHRGGRSTSRERITINTRSSSRPRGNLVAREREEFVIRRRRPPSPSPCRSPTPPPPSPPCRDDHVDEEEIIIKRTHTRPRTPTPPPPPPPEPEPEPIRLEPIIRPPIHQEIYQEIITHHRHIDHGVIRARSPTPPPPPREPTPPPPPPVEEKLEVEITRIESRGGRREDEEIKIKRSESRGGRREEREVEFEDKVETFRSRSRARSLDSHHHHHHHHDDFEEEASYYNSRAMDHGHIGEAYDGATRHWGVVDIPPGTERVRMDGAGGGSQEITWQRYNGDRRSKFISGEREYATGFGERSSSRRSVGHRHRDRDMWTEVTKDLVLREACDAMGYEYEESEYYFYVMEYLKYEDVLQLVELSDDIRRRRRRSVRSIGWEDDRRSTRTTDRELSVDVRSRRR